MSRALRIGALCIVAWAGLGATPTDPQYTIIELGHLGGNYTEPHAINDRRQVVGLSVFTDDFIHPFLWQNGQMTDLGLLPDGIAADAQDINFVGDVVGAGTAASHPDFPHAILCRQGRVIELGMFPGGFAAQAFAINDWGLIAGMADDGVATQATVWWQGRPIALGALPSSVGYSEAADVNNLGQVVGRSLMDSVRSHATLWERGRIIDLGTLPGDDHSMAFAINDRSQIVGLSGNVGQSTQRAFLWEHGVMRDLGIPPGATFSGATDINLFGVVLGHAGMARVRAGLFFRGQFFRLPLRPGDEDASGAERHEQSR
jgi:probable HAF family extracellular repeat protein